MTGSESNANEMSTFLAKGSQAALDIKTAYNSWVNNVSMLDASKGSFAAAFQNTKTLVEQQLTALSNEMNGIATNVSEVSKVHQQADQEQDDALKASFAALQQSR